MAAITQLSPNGVMGRRYSFTAKGAASPVTLVLRIALGAVELLTTGALTPPSGATNVPWEMEGLLVVRSIGASGTIMATGRYDNGQSAGLLANAAAVTVDTTASADLQVTAQWGTADAANSLTVQNLTIEKVT